MNQTTFEFIGHSTEEKFPMAVSERPQQRFENFGASALSDTELLAMMIQGVGTGATRAVALARTLMAEAG